MDQGLILLSHCPSGRSARRPPGRWASLGIASGEVGARSASEHAPAAYIASFAGCRDLCCVIWPSFDPLDLDEGCRLGATESALGELIPAGTSVYAESDAPSQRSLSAKLEARSVSSLMHNPALTRARRCHLAAVRGPGSGAWLTATPGFLGHAHPLAPLPNCHVASSSYAYLGQRLGLQSW